MRARLGRNVDDSVQRAILVPSYPSQARFWKFGMENAESQFWLGAEQLLITMPRPAIQILQNLEER